MDVLRFALTMLVASHVAVNLAIDWLQMAGAVMVSMFTLSTNTTLPHLCNLISHRYE